MKEYVVKSISTATDKINDSIHQPGDQIIFYLGKIVNSRNGNTGSFSSPDSKWITGYSNRAGATRLINTMKKEDVRREELFGKNDKWIYSYEIVEIER